MADDWQIGDLALRIAPTNHNAMFPPPDGHARPRQGQIYEVEGLALDFFGCLGLILKGAHSTHPRGPAWMATSFRKITPPAADEFDRETIELMNRKPVGQPVS